MKQPKGKVIPAKAGIQEEAETLLTAIAKLQSELEKETAEYNRAVASITERHEYSVAITKEGLVSYEKELLKLMKKNKGVLFDGTDVVNLQHGSLIHNKADKVSIPKTALDDCKAQGFNDVIIITESLDRDKIEKWPDAKLVLIGAERKPKETFSYGIK